MKNRRRISGFTMAEMLIVVAIIAVLGGVGFVAVQNYQRSMAQLECDAIAKEIFVAAQNHLTMADSQGYLGITFYGSPETIDEDTDIFGRKVYYYTVNGSSSFHDNPLLNMMLPFGSIDETVRLGGSYIIRYQPNPAQVLDVFYCSTTDPRFSHTLKESEYNTLLGIRDTYNADGTIKDNNKNARKKYGNAVVGWFGGISTVSTGVYTLKAPTIRVFNEETLSVEITDPNLYRVPELMPNLKLIVSGKEAEVSFLLTHFDSINNPIKPSSTSMKRLQKTEDDPSSKKIIKYTILLDDITQEEMHFADLNKSSSETGVNTNGKAFIPGEDITIQAVSYSNNELTNIAYSPSWTTNSLFGYVETETVTDKDTTMNVAMIGNFRHLENLDDHISGLDYDTLNITHAKQIADLSAPPEDDSIPEPSAEGKKDLSWAGFKSAVGIMESEQIRIYGFEDTSGTVDFRPISPSYALDYDGQGHEISGIVANYSENAGLFGSLIADSHVKNLKLIDFEIKSTSTNGNAGALAGTLNHTTVSNVLAYHKNDSATITATNGDAGGLVGNMTGGKIEQCAAALYVQAGTNAGGLVGSAKDANITASYSGGHTKEGSYSDNIETDSAAVNGLVNVIGGTNAGGLIGAATGNTSIQYCYSTCSTYAKISGGLIGNASNGVTVAENYAAGRVLATAEEGASRGMFLGSGTLALGSIEGKTVSNYYVSGINGTLGSGADESVVKVFEMSKVTDNATTSPYDATLTDKLYSYLTVAQLSGNATDESHLKIHYGDWQEPVVLKTGLELINAEKLTAKVFFPEAKLDEGQMVTMLVHGTKDARLLFALEKTSSGDSGGASSDSYQLSLREASGIAVKNIRGENLTSDKWLEIVLNDVSLNAGNIMFSIDLDDITTPNGHFSELFPEFLPGEDITVAVLDNEATLDEMKVLAEKNSNEWTKKDADGNIVQIMAARTNSLFASVNSEKTASIGNFRHLENLDGVISDIGDEALTGAVQTTDLTWPGFRQALGAESIKVYGQNDETGTKENCLHPVSPSYTLSYNGQGFSIKAVTVDYEGPAGLFGSMTDGSVSNLELIDFSVTGTGDAGALAGTLAGTNVTNVLAHNSTNATTVNVSATSGNAGGLIGSMDGDKVEKCAAALIVNAGDDTHVGNAGGLIGAVSGEASVSASYSGGHTENAAYSSTNYNVTATGTAGGLIGIAGGATISNSYSTCSAKGATVGGFVGTANNASISHCYCTGLVSGDGNAFIGSGSANVSSKTGEESYYYSIINEVIIKDSEDNVTDISYKGPGNTGVLALDKTATTYKDFVPALANWKNAQPYDPTLTDYYGIGEGTDRKARYNLQTVEQLGGDTLTINNGDFVATHYGDWPAPEMLVVNK